MKFFDQKDLGNHLLQLCPKVVKHPVFKLRLVDSPECDGWKWESETASHVLCDCTALAALRFRQLAHHFLQPADFSDISNSKVLHFIQSAGLLNA